MTERDNKKATVCSTQMASRKSNGLVTKIRYCQIKLNLRDRFKFKYKNIAI